MNQLADAYSRAGDCDQAMSCCDRAVQVNPVEEVVVIYHAIAAATDNHRPLHISGPSLNGLFIITAIVPVADHVLNAAMD